MPYEYRRMSPEEREAVLAHRRERRYPWHAPPHPHREARWYLLSAGNSEHRPIMRPSERRDELESGLLGAFSSAHAEIGGWVVLPNHYHILFGLSSLDVASHLLKLLHGSTSRTWNIADGLTGRRRVWYKFSDRGIRGERHYWRALNYIHYNPVKHGYVEDPYEWDWSSVHVYYETKGRDWLRATWGEFPVGNFGAGWDD
jgi:putative transposase